mmetsp:Transcript_31399/g.101515  ORF Transcript_31399/g.101515 Transcript_31399/m.101515 type:complete len:282 (-) Transcript_31399:234-1079(-)
MSYVRARARAAGDRGGALSVRALSLTACGCMGKGVMARRPLELERGSIVLRALHEHGKVSGRRFEHTVDLTKIANRFIAPGSVLLLSHFDARLWYLKRRRQDVLQRSVDHTVDRFRIGELVIVDAVPIRTTKPSSRLAASCINTRVVSLDCSKELKHLPRIHRDDNSAGVSPCVAANGLRLFLRNEHIDQILPTQYNLTDRRGCRDTLKLLSKKLVREDLESGRQNVLEVCWRKAVRWVRHRLGLCRKQQVKEVVPVRVPVFQGPVERRPGVDIFVVHSFA